MILPITLTSIPRKCRNRLLPIFSKFIAKSRGDVYQAAPKPDVEFKSLKLKVFKELYNADFNFSGKNYDEHSYPTFIYDNFRKRFVEIVVVPKNLDETGEDYFLYSSKNLNKKVGYISFLNHKNEDKLISNGMESYNNKRFRGKGVRERQAVIERMFMLGKKNIEIISIPDAYLFHKNCGFIPISEYEKIERSEFEKLVKDYAMDMAIEPEEIIKMMVYKMDEKSILFDKNSTFAQFLDYAYSHKELYPVIPKFNVKMELSEEAIEEWKIFIEKQPILIGKNFPNYHCLS